MAVSRCTRTPGRQHISQCKEGHRDDGASLPGSKAFMTACTDHALLRAFHRRVWRCLLAVTLTLGMSSGAAAGVLGGRVVAVTDGDTITVLEAGKVQHVVRLSGIDAPEKKMPFGQRSKQSLSDLVYGRWVEVVGEKNDRYGRLVGKVLVNGRDANLAQIQAGMAWHYKEYQREQTVTDRQMYAEAESNAAMTRQGLWADPNPVPPWDWRKARRKD
ncbi:thermonuclease family protein [Polaromonas sp.]|uniref:thermonuclease family protein n=1 Tax=Polaromonas sp. TaxID=1869339 RepID=UPI00272FBD4D|nr:thermonuclease family protein [Polaromonas sp.]